jgi:hypothetical protein
MSATPSEEADRLLDEELARTGARDPREFYRERLRELRSADPTGYEQAVGYYRDVLIPGIASGKIAPLVGWSEYGQRLAAARAPGRTVSIDSSGRARDFEAERRDDLALHLPENGGTRAILVALPGELSSAQRATYDVLVSGKQRARS